MSCEKELEAVQARERDLRQKQEECGAIAANKGTDSSEYLQCRSQEAIEEGLVEAARRALDACREAAEAVRTLQTSGFVTFIRVHEPGSGFGGGNKPDSTNFIGADVIFKLDSRPDKAFGFYLRDDEFQPVRRGMLALLRDAMAHDLRVTTDYDELVTPPNQNSFARRVTLTRSRGPTRVPPVFTE